MAKKPPSFPPKGGKPNPFAKGKPDAAPTPGEGGKPPPFFKKGGRAK